jgi:glutaminyl-peptide cyclotransferase
MSRREPFWSAGARALHAALRAACFALLVVGSGPSDAAEQACGEPATLRFDIVDKITRSEIGFTEGLEVRDGRLYESTGSVDSKSGINVISLDGKVTRLVDLGTSVFGEGLTILNDQIFQLTWQEHKVFVYDRAGHLKREMHNPREGWGMTNDGTNLIFSDGSPSFFYADPETFAIRKSVLIRSNQPGEIWDLNELELVDGQLYGNIWQTHTIVRIDPATGCINGQADLRKLWDVTEPDERGPINPRDAVLNGIAYDHKTGLFYLTGKLWKTIFVGRFTETSH